MKTEFASGIVTAALAIEKKMRIIADNVANINTPGYKKEIAVFSSRPFAQATLLVEMKGELDLRQGPLQSTGNPFDMAIGSEGFFVLQGPEGIRYTRKGSFRLDPEGYLVTADGHYVMGRNGRIMVEGKVFVVNEQGDVLVDGEPVDTLRIVSFPKGASLLREGHGLFRYEGDEGLIEEVEAPMVKQGFLEGSNVEGVEEMVELIETSRLFEAYQKVLQTMDEMADEAIRTIARI